MESHAGPSRPGAEMTSAEASSAMSAIDGSRSWLAERVNTFVNVMRPRVRSAAVDYQPRGE